MAGAIQKIIIKSITKVIKSTSKFDIAVDDLIAKFKDSCPPKDELLRIVEQKNTIQTALTNVTDTINTLNSTSQSTETIITTVGTAVKVIKAIPLPTSVPPGVGIPVNVITILADSLDVLGNLIDGAKGAISIIPQATKTISKSAENILSKLSQLDGVINVCLEEMLNNMEWDPTVNYKTGDNVTFSTGGNTSLTYYQSTVDNNLNIPPLPQTSPLSWELSTAENAANKLANEINNATAASGQFSDLALNTAEEEDLISRLSPNSTDPLIYKGFVLIIESNSENKFSFPQRRILGNRPASIFTRFATSGEQQKYRIPFDGRGAKLSITIPEQTLTNLSDGGYSYSTSVKVLIDEIKFRIDQEGTGPIINNELRDETDFLKEVFKNRGSSTTTVTGRNTSTFSSGEGLDADQDTFDDTDLTTETNNRGGRFRSTQL